jgi:endonuclease/exonuclease/phosphatase family metal-dependent hydrolase
MRARVPGRARQAVAAAFVVLAFAACSPSTPSSAPASAAPPAASAAAQAPASAVPTPAPAATPAPTPAPTQAPVAFKLMDFNIEYGGEEVDFTKIIEAIKKADPDVVALQEGEGNTRKVADALGWPYASTRTQLVSRLPLIDPPEAQGRYAYVEVAPGKVVAVSSVHLPSDPYGPYAVRDGSSPDEVITLEEQTRMPMLQDRLDVLPALVAQGIPTFLTGDFNSPSHLDWTEATVGLRPQVKYPLAWPVSTAIEAAGFRDSYRELHPDPVTDPGLTWWAARPLIDGYPDPSEPQDRIDIIYSAGPASVQDEKIVGETGGPQVDVGVSPWGTDHRGVVGTFEVTPGTPAPFVAVIDRLVTAGDRVEVRYQGTGAAGEQVVVGPAGAGSAAQTGGGHPVGASPWGSWSVDTGGLAPGDYEVRLAGADGAAVAAAPFSVAAVGAKPALTVDAARYEAGDPITVTWRDAPGARWDWIGVYKAGDDPLVDSYLYYVYTDQGVQGSVVLDEHGEGDWPLKPGKYEVHYLLDDGYTSLASAPFTIAK